MRDWPNQDILNTFNQKITCFYSSHQGEAVSERLHLDHNNEKLEWL